MDERVSVSRNDTALIRFRCVKSSRCFVITNNRIDHLQLGVTGIDDTSVPLSRIGTIHIYSRALRRCTVAYYAVTQLVAHHIDAQTVSDSGVVDYHAATIVSLRRATHTYRICIHQRESIDNDAVGVHERKNMGGVVLVGARLFFACHIRANDSTIDTDISVGRLGACGGRRITAVQTHVAVGNNSCRTQVMVHIVTRTDGGQLALFHQNLDIAAYRIAFTAQLRQTVIAVIRIIVHKFLTEILYRLTQVFDRRSPAVSFLILRNEMTIFINACSIRVHENRRDRRIFIRSITAFQTLRFDQRIDYRVRLTNQTAERRRRLIRVRYHAVRRMRMYQPWRQTLHTRRSLHTLLVNSRIGRQVPYTRTGQTTCLRIYLFQMLEHTRTESSRLMVMFAPVMRVHRRIEETREVTMRILDRHIALIEREDTLLSSARPVGYIVVHECRVIDIDLLLGLILRLHR